MGGGAPNVAPFAGMAPGSKAAFAAEHAFCKGRGSWQVSILPCVENTGQGYIVISVCGSEDRSQGLIHASQVLARELWHIPSSVASPGIRWNVSERHQSPLDYGAKPFIVTVLDFPTILFRCCRLLVLNLSRCCHIQSRHQSCCFWKPSTAPSSASKAESMVCCPRVPLPHAFWAPIGA